MADTTNWDELDDDDFMAALEEAGSEPVEEAENIEDTDQTSESEPDETEEAETNDDQGIDDQESAEYDEAGFEKDDEENSQAENNSETDEVDAEALEAGSVEEDANEVEGDATDDGKADELDYKAEYAKILEEKSKYEDFYNQATAEFVANGRKTRGFDDPKKIIEAQQMAAGYSDKMAAFKKYRPFMNTLKEKGMLDSPEKFNLAMQLLEGDPEALKQQMKTLEIDPFEMDMENINYVPKNQVASDIEVALDDVMDSAGKYGVSDQVQNIISKEWDDDSVIELLEDPQNSTDLISHISSGAYEVVQDRIAEKKRSDSNQVYSSKPMIQQYREAAQELESEYMQYLQQEQANQGQEQGEPEGTEAPAWIPANDPIEAQQAEKYKAKVEKQNAQTNEARRKATSMSKKKRGARKPKQQVDPLSLDDDKFTEYMDSLIYQ